jgi:hypothetical protein
VSVELQNVSYKKEQAEYHQPIFDPSTRKHVFSPWFLLLVDILCKHTTLVNIIPRAIIAGQLLSYFNIFAQLIFRFRSSAGGGVMQ